jgi:phosphoribosyl-ATP pyrophosphohydrolase
MSDDVLKRLAATIKSRREDAGAKSYTRQLLDGGPEKCAKKLGEEAVETVMAGAGESAERLREEAADLLYHLLVLLESREVAIADVLAVLGARMGTSGLTEKAERGKR